MSSSDARRGAISLLCAATGQNLGGVEIYMLFPRLIFISIWAARDPATLDRVSTLGMAGANRSAFESLTSLGSVAELILPFALATVILIVFKWLLEERRRACNRAKHFYLASTAALFGAMLIHPIAGHAARWASRLESNQALVVK